MVKNPSLLIPQTAAQEDALLAEKESLFKALDQFTNVSLKAPELRDLSVMFAQVASEAAGKPALHPEMEDAYNLLSFTAMAKGLRTNVELHRGLLIKHAFIRENTHIHVPRRDYTTGLDQMINEVRNITSYFYDQAKGALNAGAGQFTVQGHATAHANLDRLAQTFQLHLEGRGLPISEITESEMEYAIERGNIGVKLSTGFRNTMVASLGVMRQELGFYNYVYDKCDYPLQKIADARIETRDEFCDIMNGIKGFVQRLAEGKKYVDFEVQHAKISRAQAAERTRPPQFH